ncbi:MFS transporter [Providencia sp. PROV196]|uniref:MFS transporter n=1 Tax=Providencia sp. PROV196 TaxID=2949897 RepID=UPI00234B1FDC|nr:MFS transporter [Providencia sp. PROV196]
MSNLFFLMLFCVLTADCLMVFLTPVLVYQLTGSIEYSGLSYALWWLPRILIIPLIGKYIDRLGVRPLSILSDVIKSIGCLFLAFNDFSSDLIIAVAFGIVGSLISIGNSQTIISYEKIISLISYKKEYHVNLISRMDFSGMIVGPLIGMIIIDYGIRTVLIIPLLLYIINALFFILKKKELSNMKHEDNQNVSGQENGLFKHHFIYIFSIPILFLTVLLAIGNNMFDSIIESSGTALIDKEMGLPAKYFGFIDVAAGLCGVTGTYLYSSLTHFIQRKKLLLSAVLIITGSSIFLISYPSSFIIFVCFYAISIIGKVFTGNICRMVRIECIPSNYFAGVSSIIVLLNQSVLPFIGMVIYFFGDSTTVIYYFMSVAVMISFISGVYVYRHIASSV